MPSTRRCPRPDWAARNDGHGRHGRSGRRCGSTRHRGTGSAHLRDAVELRREVAAAASGGGVVELQLADVRTFDLPGIGLLVGLHREARAAGGELVCVAPPARLYGALRRMGLHRVLRIRLDVGTEVPVEPQDPSGPPGAPGPE